MNVPTRFEYEGRDIETLNRDELLQALKDSILALTVQNTMMKTFKRGNDLLMKLAHKEKGA